MTPTSPWQLIRHLWVQQFKRNPIIAVLAPLMLLGGTALLLFFSVFLTVGVITIGAIAMLARSLLGAGSGSVPPSAGRYQYESRTKKEQSNNELEGEYKVISRDE